MVYLFLIFSILFGSSAHAFTDVAPANSHSRAMEYVWRAGIVDTYPGRAFAPTQSVSRAELIAIVMKANYTASEIAACNTAIMPFKDVSPTAEYAPYICSAYQYGIISGYSDGRVRPERPVSFGEAAKIIASAHGDEPYLPNAPWYESSVRLLADLGAIPVDIQSFNQKVNRGQIAEVIYRIRAKDVVQPSKTYNQLMAPVNSSPTTLRANNPYPKTTIVTQPKTTTTQSSSSNTWVHTIKPTYTPSSSAVSKSVTSSQQSSASSNTYSSTPVSSTSISSESSASSASEVSAKKTILKYEMQ